MAGRIGAGDAGIQALRAGVRELQMGAREMVAVSAVKAYIQSTVTDCL